MVDAEHIATPARRVGAWFVDLIINILVTSLVANAGWTYAIATLLIGAYRFICVGVWGETIGYRIANIRVVRYDDGESVPTWKQSFIRVVVLIVIPVIGGLLGGGIGGVLALVGVGFGLAAVLSIPGDDEKRGFHDKLSGTAVIRVSA